MEFLYNHIENAPLRRLTIGYGERPSNVVLTPIAIVVLFFFIYIVLDALSLGSTYADYLIYSV